VIVCWSKVNPVVDVDRGDVGDTREDGGGIVGDPGCLQVDVFRGPAQAEGSKQHSTFEDEVLAISGLGDAGEESFQRVEREQFLNIPAGTSGELLDGQERVTGW
jgi:hypothetical protein